MNSHKQGMKRGNSRLVGIMLASVLVMGAVSECKAADTWVQLAPNGELLSCQEHHAGKGSQERCDADYALALSEWNKSLKGDK